MAPRLVAVVPAVAAVLTWSFLHARPSMALEDVKVHTSGSTSANVLIYKIAQEKGFYKEKNLNVLTIAATSQAGIQGLVGGSLTSAKSSAKPPRRFCMARRLKMSWFSTPSRFSGFSAAKKSGAYRI